MVKEISVAAKVLPNLLRGRRADGVVRRWRERQKESSHVIGRIMPPELSNMSLSLMVSQRTEQNMVCRVFFWTSLKEKPSTRSSEMEGSVSGCMSLTCVQKLETRQACLWQSQLFALRTHSDGCRHCG